MLHDSVFFPSLYSASPRTHPGVPGFADLSSFKPIPARKHQLKSQSDMTSLTAKHGRIIEDV